MNRTASHPLLDGFKPMAGKLIGAALNRGLALDAETQTRVQRMEGRRFAIEITAPSLAFEVRVEQGQLVLGPEQTGEPDLGIKTKLSGVLSQLPIFRQSTSAPVGGMRINGDVELARLVQEIVQGFNPDWEQPFIDAFGVVLGVQMARAVKAAFKQAREAGGKFSRDAAQYLTEESRDAVGSAEQAAFFDDVDALRDRAERLAATVAHLQAKAGA